MSDQSLWSEIEARRFTQVERRLNEIGSQVKGNQDFQADRIADVLEQIAEVAKSVDKLSARVTHLALYLDSKKDGK